MVWVGGEVRYPGRYTLKSTTERLSDVIARAGGLTPKAYANGVVFNRKRNKTGRVGLDLPEALRNPRHGDNIELVDGDSIMVPAYEPIVLMKGALNSPVAVAYVPGASIDYYIRAAGGGNTKADVKKAYVSQANGKVESRNRHLLLFRSTPRPDPGSTVFVPEKDPNQRFDWASLVTTSTSLLTAVITIIAVTR